MGVAPNEEITISKYLRIVSSTTITALREVAAPPSMKSKSAKKSLIFSFKMITEFWSWKGMSGEGDYNCKVVDLWLIGATSYLGFHEPTYEVTEGDSPEN